MTGPRRALLLAAAFGLAGCDAITQPPVMIADSTVGWKSAATSADRARLHDWRTSLVNALTAARKAGHGADIDREGALLDPDAALANPAIPNGTFACRVIKLGAKSEGLLDYVAYPEFTCAVSAEHGLQRLDKRSGSQRYVGLVFPNDSLRLMFLGTLVLGDEQRAMQYGQDERRNVAGFIERIGPARWRLLMPEPHFESRTDVMELVPMSRGE